MSNQIVIFSHGFGVRRDNRGMFTEIAEALDCPTILFDYNQYDEATNTLTVAPLSQQAAKLRQVIADAKADHPGATIDLICHSQGCIAAGLAKPAGLRNIILIAPATTLNAARMVAVFGSRPGAHLDFAGDSRFPRRDGSTTIVPKTYWPDLENLKPVELFNELAKTANVTIIEAGSDEIVGPTDFTNLSPNATRISIKNANHDFTGTAHPKLIRAITEALEPSVVIVNENDEVIGHKTRSQLERDRPAIYRVTGLWLTNSQGDILLAQRALDKTHDPGVWGPAAAGTVEDDDTYDSNIIKEIEEELGLKDLKLTKGPKRRAANEYNYFVQWYTAVIDKPAADFMIQKEEVEQVRWFSREELARELRDHPKSYFNLGWALEEL